MSSPSARPASVPPDAEADAAGALRIGRYVIEGTLGRGGMGVVYRAFDPGLGRPVAIKVISDPDRLEARGRERFFQEARAAARLSHPGIVAVHEVGEDEAGRPYLVMDFIDGVSLEARHTAERLPPRSLAEVVRQVADALQHAHDHGIIHRDVKPQNVILGLDGRARLCDLGLAREIDRDATGITVTGQLLGTPSFMAPEQVDGGERVGPTTDVFGLGGLLYWLLTGQAPFAGETIVEVLRKVVVVDPTPPRELHPEVHLDLETIALRCLEKEPDRRYPDAAEVAAELGRFLAGEPIQARPLGAAARVTRWARRNRLLTAALGVAVWTLIGSVVAVVAIGVVERRRFVDQLRGRARASAEAFEEARARAGERPAGDELDQLLARSSDALGDARSWLAAASDEAEPRELAFRTAMTTGEVALASEQWSVAAGAFDRAIQLGLDDEAARSALARVATARARTDAERRRAVEAVLARFRSREAADIDQGREAALFELARHPGESTMALLRAEIVEVTADLHRTSRETFLAAATPTADEARAGAESIERLAEAVDAWLAHGTDERGAPRPQAHDDRRGGITSLPPDLQTAFLKGRDRIVARASRGRVERERERMQAAGILAILGAAQERAIGRRRLATAALCADAIGWLMSPRAAPALSELAAPSETDPDVPEPTIDVLGRWVVVEMDELRAIPPGRALARIGGRRAAAWLRVARVRFGRDGPFWRAVRRSLPSDWMASSVGTGAGDGSARWHFERAEALGDEGDVEGAIAAYDRAIELDPRDAWAWNNRGIARRRLGDLQGAVADYAQAIEVDPRFAGAWTNRAVARSELGDTEGALADYARALEIEPRSPGIWNNRGLLKSRLGDLAGALADLDRALEIDSWSLEGWNTRGNIKNALGDHVGAVADFDRALELDPSPAITWSNRASARRQSGDLDGAAADYDRALELDPRCVSAWTGRGNIRRTRGDLEGAIADYDQAVELDPGDVFARYNRGLARHAQRDLAGAIADLDRAVEIAPRLVEAWSSRGTIRRDLGDLAGALADYDRALDIDPENAEARTLRGSARLARGDAAGALEDFDRVVAGDPENLKARIGRSNVALARGDDAGAVAELDRVVEIAPRFAFGWAARGSAKTGIRDPEGALADYDRALELDPGLVIVWSNRANLKVGLGDFAGAFADVSRALELEPRLAQAWAIRGDIHAERGEVDAAISDYERFLELGSGPLVDVVRRHLAEVRARR